MTPMRVDEPKRAREARQRFIAGLRRRGLPENGRMLAYYDHVIWLSEMKEQMEP